jgi:hypothetical protein
MIVSRINAFALTLNLIPVSPPMMSLTITVYLMADNSSRLIRDSPSIGNANNYDLNSADPYPFHLMLHAMLTNKGRTSTPLLNVHLFMMLNMLISIQIPFLGETPFPMTGKPILLSTGGIFQRQGRQ